jgi:type II secretory pathway component PulF
MLLALPFFVFPALSFAAEGGCAAKAQEIQKQIDYATQHGNTHRVAGLKKALSEVQTNCTEAGLQTGNLDKVAKKQKKLAEAQAELKQAQAE